MPHTAVGACTMHVVQRRQLRAISSHGAVVIAAITSCTNTSNPA